MTSPIHFVLNSHGLGFDRYSLLCIKSLRSVCGPGAQISVFCPDNLPSPSENALRFYDRYGVGVRRFHNEFLPERVTDASAVPARHLTYNKLYTLQGMAAGERRVFLDADIVVLRNPIPYLERIDEPTGVSPVNTPEAFGGSWRQLYEGTGVEFPKERLEVWTTYVYGKGPEPPKTEMPPYFSSGIVAASAESGVPSLWLELCRELEAKRHLVPRTFFLDQVALSVAVQKAKQPYHVIPRAFNATFEIWRYTADVHLFHYIGFDTLAAAAARFPEVKRVADVVVRRLAKEDGLDLRFQILTQWPRWYRRVLGILAGRLDRWLGLVLVKTPERT